MAKKNKSKNSSDLILTQGLVIGEDTTRLINIAPQGDLLYLDVTLYCPEFKYEPHQIFDPQTLDKIERFPQKSDKIYDDALRSMFDEHVYDMGFQHDVLQQGITFSFVSHKDMQQEKHYFDEPRLPQLLSVTPVQAQIEKQISINDANDFCADFRDERLDQLLAFTRGHDFIAANKGRFGSKYNFQTIMAGIGNITQNACNNFVFKHRIETINRVRRDDYDRTSFRPAYNFINTTTALAQKLGEKCRTFIDIKTHDSAVMNNLAINHFAQNKNNLFSSRQTQSLAKLYHKQSGHNNAYRPTYQRR